MSEFGIVISCFLNPEDTEKTVLVLDSVYDNSVSSTATMTAHPVVGGYEVADHIFNEPDTMSIRGTLSFNGNRGIKIDKEGFKFVDFQEMFENIKKNGVLCEIVKVHIINTEEGKQDAKFKIRNNMVLQSINWVEKINSLDFTFNFKQAMLVDVEEVEVDSDDLFAPNVTEPKTLNFTDTLIDWNVVNASIISNLNGFKLISDEFIRYIKSMTAASLIALGVAVAVAAVVLSIPGVGLAAALIAAAVAASLVIVKGLVNFFKKAKDRVKYKVEAFKLYKNKKKSEKEAKRFADFLDSIHKEFTALNERIKVYAVSSNEPQECLLSIKDEYYIFTFTKNNTNQKYSLVVKDLNEVERGSLSDVTACPESFDQLHDSNAILKTSTTWSYLLCPGMEKNDLTKYFILVSDISMNEYNNIMEEVIKNAIMH